MALCLGWLASGSSQLLHHLILQNLSRKLEFVHDATRRGGIVFSEIRSEWPTSGCVREGTGRGKVMEAGVF